MRTTVVFRFSLRADNKRLGSAHLVQEAVNASIASINQRVKVRVNDGN